MRLVEQHVIKSNNEHYKDLKHLCFLSKNIYNTTLYEVRQFFFKEHKYLPYNKVDKLFKDTNNVDYRSLPIQSAQQVMRIVDSSFKSFFKLLSKKKIGSYNKKINIPHYLDKNGHFILTYTYQQLSYKYLKEGIIKLPLSNIEFKTKVTNIKQVRFIPKSNYIVMEVIYNIDEIPLKDDNGHYAAVDLGINNLATVVSNISQSYIINGRPIKSINQYYNKQKAYYQSKLKSQKTSNRIRKLTFKRNNKIKDYFHKASKHIVNQLVSDSINTIIIGRNKDWKQDINMGTQVDQTFVSIPHSTLISMISYKCRLNGIKVILREESYTSKALFIDNDKIPDLKDKNPTFSGKRIKRGLYRTKNGILINSDINGAYNILRKEVGDVVLPTDRGHVFNPRSYYMV